jgi:hypothetical protein
MNLSRRGLLASFGAARLARWRWPAPLRATSAAEASAERVTLPRSTPSASPGGSSSRFLRPLFEQAAMFRWLPARELSGDTRWERLLAASRARGIHFHWILPLDHRADEIATLSRMYERAILETDYAALSREQDRVIAALCAAGASGSEMRG